MRRGCPDGSTGVDGLSTCVDMATTSPAVRSSGSEPQALAGSSKPEQTKANGSHPHEADAAGARADVATVAAIGIAAYTVTDLTYLGFHAAACAYSGCELVEIASSAVRKLPPDTPGFEPFLVHAGGTMGNLAVFLLGWALTARNSEWPTPLKYFLWLTMTLNGLVAGGQILISNAFDAGDWAMLSHNWPYRILWKLLFTAIGFGIAMFAFTISRGGIEIFLGRKSEHRRALLPILAGVPYVAGGIFITATAALSVNNKLESIVVAAVWTFGLTAWLLILARIPHLPRPRTPHRPLHFGRSLPWMAAAAILAIAFAAVLGPGIWLYS